MKIYICRHCGNIIVKLEDSKVSVVCCGENMQLLVANTVDAAVEKHIPVINRKDNEVEVVVGSVEHPMTPEHHISWIILVTEKGHQVKYLDVNESPRATFLVNENVLEVYEYCNLHGLWKLDIK